MDLFTQADLYTLVAQRPGPCVSLFIPTHRGGSKEDPIRWRVHLSEAEKQLVAQGMRATEAKELLHPARHLLEEPTFWKHQCDGLACFLAPQFLRLYRLPVAFQEFVLAAAHFQIKPLLPLLSDNGRFYLLALSKNAVRLLQGTRDSVSEVDLTGVPRNLAEALLTHDRDEPLTFHTRPTGGLGHWGAIFHGQGVGIDDAKDDLLRYFQKIDSGLHAILRDEQAPLMLAAVEYLVPLYRHANTYPHLLGEHLTGNPDQLSAAELHDRAWAMVRPQFQKGQQQALAEYQQVNGTPFTAIEPWVVVPAAVLGEVATLFVALDHQVWGHFNVETGEVQSHPQPEPGDEDLTNLAALFTLRHQGTVFALPAAAMPDGQTLAAIFC